MAIAICAQIYPTALSLKRKGNSQFDWTISVKGRMNGATKYPGFTEVLPSMGQLSDLTMFEGIIIYPYIEKEGNKTTIIDTHICDCLIFFYMPPLLRDSMWTYTFTWCLTDMCPNKMMANVLGEHRVAPHLNLLVSAFFHSVDSNYLVFLHGIPMHAMACWDAYHGSHLRIQYTWQLEWLSRHALCTVVRVLTLSCTISLVQNPDVVDNRLAVGKFLSLKNYTVAYGPFEFTEANSGCGRSCDATYSPQIVDPYDELLTHYKSPFLSNKVIVFHSWYFPILPTICPSLAHVLK